MSSFKKIEAAAAGVLLAAAIAGLPAQSAPAKHAPRAAMKLLPVPPAPVSAAAPVSATTSQDTVPPNTSVYTGVVIDARGLPDILRSPAPAIYGACADATLVYPDRAHVPTPDEVQDESIVRYYHTPDEAARGVGGSNPLIIKAVAVLGPAKDALQVSAADMQTLLDADKSLHFTRSWRVGFLVPADK